MTQGLDGHRAVDLVMLHPGPARALTCTWSSLVWNVSMSRTIRAGCWTVTPRIVDPTVTSSFTPEPGLACVASTVAVMLSGSTIAMRSARPVIVTVILLGGLIKTIGLVPTLSVSPLGRVREVGGVCGQAARPGIDIARPRAS